MTTAEAPARPAKHFSKFSEGIRAFDEATLFYKSRKHAAAAARRRLKSASFDNNDSEFENAFASIAFTYLKERAPGLVEHLVGFQLLDKSEENQKACGVFVCQVGQRLIDVPMFFINGELKGYQVMRIRNPEMFLVLREGFLDYIISQLTQDIGEIGPPTNSRAANRTGPNLDVFAGQRYFKGASENLDHLDDWAKDLKVAEEYLSMRLDTKSLQYGSDLLHKKASYVSVKELLHEYEPLLKTAKELASDYPRFEKLMSRVAGDSWRDIKPKTNKLGGILPPPAIKQRHELDLKIGKTASEPRKSTAGALVIQPKRKLPEIAKIAQQLGHDTEPLVQEADKFGEVLFDRREQEYLNSAFDIDDGYQSYRPDSIEVCSVLTPDSDFRDMLVVPAKYSQSYPAFDLVYDFNRKQFAYASPDAYVAKRKEGMPLQDEKAAVDKVIKGRNTKPKEGEVFFVVDNNNQFFGPFLCREKHGPREYSVDCIGYHNLLEGDFMNRSLGGGPIAAGGDAGEVSKLIFSRNNFPASTNQVKYSMHLIVPGNSRVLSIKKMPPPRDNYDDGPSSWYSYKYDDRDSVKLDLTDLSTFIREMVYGRSNLKIAADGNIITLNNFKLDRGQARRALMVQYELSKTAAEEILEKANKTSRRYIVTHVSELADKTSKLAFYAPGFNEPEERPIYPSRSGRFGVQEADFQSIQTNDIPEQTEDLEPWEDPDEESFDQQEELDALLQNDHGNIMDDMAGFISLLRNTRIDTSTRKLTKSLLNTIDQLGRQIFIFYAHQDEYKETFGENEVADIESSLITVFEGAGDLFISLVRRSDDPTPELDIVDLPVS